MLMHDNRRKKRRRTLIIYLESGKIFGQLFFLGGMTDIYHMMSRRVKKMVAKQGPPE